MTTFFTNIHPNSRCLGLIADWETEKMEELFGSQLPNPRTYGLAGNGRSNATEERAE